MVVVAGIAGMPHPRERRAGGANEREEERPRVMWPEVPAEPLAAVDLERGLIVGQRNELAARNRAGHERHVSSRHTPCAVSVGNSLRELPSNLQSKLATI